MKEHTYEIVTCCGDPVAKPTILIPDDSEPEFHELEAMKAAGLTNYECGSCYDRAYHVRY